MTSVDVLGFHGADCGKIWNDQQGVVSFRRSHKNFRHIRGKNLPGFWSRKVSKTAGAVNFSDIQLLEMNDLVVLDQVKKIGPVQQV